jgi:predicted permease
MNRELDEELQSHLDEAIDRGRDPLEARRAFGSSLQTREASRDIRVAAWLDSLRADAIFGWRQLMKSKVTSAAAILSLALAIGACTSAFRLIDALLLRNLPIADPDRLYAISFEKTRDDGKPAIYDSCSYPMFKEMRAAVKDRAEVIAISYTQRTDLTYGSDEEMEKANLQSVSGWMFDAFGLRPAEGRLLTENDDLKPDAHPYAVLSYDYWTRRFGQDPKAVGRTFRIGNTIYEVAGVVAPGFTGVEPGTLTDMFVPMAMRGAGVLSSQDSFWLRTFVRIKPGVAVEPLREQMAALYGAIEETRAKRFVRVPQQGPTHKEEVRFLLDPAGAGVSQMQRQYGSSLVALSILVLLVLLIGCANVANLMTAQAAARTREMALRASIGAGRARLVQLMLIESAWIAFAAAAIGAVFAWWSAPFVVSRINPPDNPARLVLLWDWRVLAFGLALTLAVTLLFGLTPALRASSVRPSNALKGGDDPRLKRRLMHVLIAGQAAFCFVVLFVSSLFTASFDRLSKQPTGFSADRVLTLETLTSQPQLPEQWEDVASHLRTVPGVETVATAGWPLLTGEMRNNYVSIAGAPPDGVLAFFLAMSPGWLDTMKIPLIDGRDFRLNDAYPSSAIVNQTFARHYFAGIDAVGKTFETMDGRGVRTRLQIVGIAGDAIYRNLREPMLPIAYVPFRSVAETGAAQPKSRGTFVVRTRNSDPLELARALRRKVTEARSEFRVSNVRTQKEIDDAQTIRERLLATLALFFAGVALLLSGIGLYGVLEYSVLQRRREIGIRLAIGAPVSSIARLVSARVFGVVVAGALVGLVLGKTTAHQFESLFFEVKSTDLAMLAIPSLLILAAALLAALPAIIRAVRLDPVDMLRSE